MYKNTENGAAQKYAICEAPVCVGSPTRGSEDAFSQLRKNGLEELFKESARFAEFGMPRWVRCTENDPRLKELETVVHVNKGHYKNLMSAFEQGLMPITIGGDHSVAMASIAALSDSFGYEKTAVIYIDGHTDINTEESSKTGYIHGMPLAAAMGLCSDKLKIGQRNVNLLGSNTYIIGARSIDDGEYPIIEKQGVHLYTAEEVNRRGASSVIDEVLEAVRGFNVHISFDVDCIDGAEFRSTGYIMPNGLSYNTVYQMIEKILGSIKPASFDCVEYNPHLDLDGADRKKLLDIFRLFT